jgi:hypothetical protein
MRSQSKPQVQVTALNTSSNFAEAWPAAQDSGNPVAISSMLRTRVYFRNLKIHLPTEAVFFLGIATLN